MQRNTLVISHIYSNPLVDVSKVDDSIVVPVPLLNHQEEHTLLKDIVNQCAHRFPVQFNSVPATTESFQSCYSSSKILHFCGKLSV